MRTLLDPRAYDAFAHEDALSGYVCLMRALAGQRIRAGARHWIVLERRIERNQLQLD